MKGLIILICLFVIFGLGVGQECGDGYFKCDNGRCIWGPWYCDHEDDCGDSSDEPETCPLCPFNYWQCANGDCVRTTYICDGETDCKDNSDEINPETGICPICPDKFFQCLNGQCIPDELVCDNFVNCRDASDENEALCSILPVGKNHHHQHSGLRKSLNFRSQK